MNSLFDEEKIKDRIRHLVSLPPFKPDKDELRFTVTQPADGVYRECTLFFVVRNGEMIFYDSKVTNP